MCVCVWGGGDTKNSSPTRGNFNGECVYMPALAES